MDKVGDALEDTKVDNFDQTFPAQKNRLWGQVAVNNVVKMEVLETETELVCVGLKHLERRQARASMYG